MGVARRGRAREAGPVQIGGEVQRQPQGVRRVAVGGVVDGADDGARGAAEGHRQARHAQERDRAGRAGHVTAEGLAAEGGAADGGHDRRRRAEQHEAARPAGDLSARGGSGIPFAEADIARRRQRRTGRAFLQAVEIEAGRVAVAALGFPAGQAHRPGGRRQPAARVAGGRADGRGGGEGVVDRQAGNLHPHRLFAVEPDGIETGRAVVVGDGHRGHRSGSISLGRRNGGGRGRRIGVQRGREVEGGGRGRRWGRCRGHHHHRAA